MKSAPLWIEGMDRVAYPALSADLSVDVLVIGGGITGVSCAHKLAEAGVKVALLERSRLGSGYTSHTTAHLTYMTDTRLSEIIRTCGEQAAKVAWSAGSAAMEHIKAVAEKTGADFELRQVPGYLVASVDFDLAKERERLRDETATARRMGFDVEFLEEAPPTGRPGIRFANQLKFHPLKYLEAIAVEASENGARIFENTNVTEFGTDPGHVIANGYRIIYEKVIIATHVPMQGNRNTLAATVFQTKLASYSTYAVAGRAPKDSLPEMIWSNTADPFDYLRIDARENDAVIIFGGEDHKTGQVVETGDCYSRLEERLKEIAPDAEVFYHWSGQVVETVDGLPYIGENLSGQFIATGFSGNGMTFGVAAALMACEWGQGREMPWQKEFDPARAHLSAAVDYIKENKDYPWRMVKDRFAIADGNVTEIAPGEGRVIHADGENVAICRDTKGTLHKLSAVCPHLGCIVAWNEAEGTWDCPCHGSRFAADGSLIAGPAEKNLQPSTS